MKTTTFSSARIGLLAALMTAMPVAWTSGCLAVAAGAAGAGTVAYLRGELDASVAHPLNAVDHATNEAGRQLGFAKINEGAVANGQVLTFRTADDTKVEVHLIRTTNRVTRVTIRVGLFGNEPLSRTFLDKIRSNVR